MLQEVLHLAYIIHEYLQYVLNFDPLLGRIPLIVPDALTLELFELLILNHCSHYCTHKLL